MNDFRSKADFAKESGLSVPIISGLLKDVTPAFRLGNTSAYHPDALRAALINKHKDVLKYLNVLTAAAKNLSGYGAE